MPWRARKRRTVITLSQSNQPLGCGFLRQMGPIGQPTRRLSVIDLLAMMFLICSHDMLCSVHESSILSCPQAPAGHGALRAGGCAFFFSPTPPPDPARAAAPPRRPIPPPPPLPSPRAPPPPPPPAHPP